MFLCSDCIQETIQKFWKRERHPAIFQRKTQPEFFSVGKCFVIEALLEFFQMDSTKHKPTANNPHSVEVLTEEYRKHYIINVLDKFMDEFVLPGGNKEVADGIWCYSVNIIKCFFLILADFKDAVSTCNGEHLLILRKQLLCHFFTTTGFNEFSIEMLIKTSCNAKCYYQKQRHIAANGQLQLIGKAVPGRTSRLTCSKRTGIPRRTS